MRRFEQGTSKTKVYHNTVSLPCKVKAQTDVLEVCLHSSMFLADIEEFFDFLLIKGFNEKKGSVCYGV